MSADDVRHKSTIFVPPCYVSRMGGYIFDQACGRDQSFVLDPIESSWNDVCATFATVLLAELDVTLDTCASSSKRDSN